MNLFNKCLLLISAAILAVAMMMTSCRNDDSLTDTIFGDDSADILDPNSYTYKLDSFLRVEFLIPYNVRFIYKMEDKGTDMNYNLVPATYEKSKEMAVLTKYLWFEAYDKIAGVNFLKKTCPRIIHLIGSPAYNPATGTELLGLAEGGLKVSLFKVNELDVNNVEAMSELFFKTMHHEFSHILHQTKAYPKDFNLFSYKDYNPLGWQDRNDSICFSLGFVSPYGGSQTREDWVEVIANYIVKTDKWWDKAYEVAAKGWIQKDKMQPELGALDYELIKEVELNAQGDTVWNADGTPKMVEKKRPLPDTDGVDGAAMLRAKLAMCKEWLLVEWGVDLEALRAEVQYRQDHINLDSLLRQLK
ncbi:MAG: putative zinc-binding metallopeptidase [Prevotellaceae bacterium]|jgi:substrate import-associated zinc metallohydrolase lipoprotein|nr:putative zinc-binding metallopeptidase [Prevotellaceae bacterium]